MFAQNVRGTAIVVLVAVLAVALVPPTFALPLGGLYGGELQVAVLGPIDVDPLVRDPGNVGVHELIYDALARRSPTTLLPEPYLATGWTLDPANATIVVHVRTGATFADGTALDAAAVATTFTNYLAAGRMSGFAATGTGQDVTFTFTSGAGTFLDDWITWPVAYKSGSTTPSASGLFTVAEDVPGYLRLAANPGHWSGRPFPDSIRFTYYASMNDAACAIINRDVDVLGFRLGSNDLTDVRDCAGIPAKLQDPGNESLAHLFIAVNPGLEYLQLGVNNARPPLNDPAFRVAVSSAMDRELIVQIEPFSEIADSVVLPANAEWFNASVPRYRVEKGIVGGLVVTILDNVNAMLDAAGYFDRNSDGWREMPDGTPFNLTFLHLNVTTDPRVAKVQSIVANLNGIGVELVEEELPPDQIIARAAADDFDIALVPGEATTDPGFLMRFHSSRIAEWTNFNVADPGLDASLESMRDSMDLDTRVRAAKDAQGWLAETGAAVPLVHYRALNVYDRTDFEGWLSPVGGILNFGSFSGIHVVQRGPMGVDLTAFAASLLSDGETTVLVTVKDADDNPLPDANLELTGGTFAATTGVTGPDGRFTTTFTAPTVGATTDVTLTVLVTKSGYDDGSAATMVTVHPVAKRLSVAVARGTPTLEAGESTTVTVQVQEAATTQAVSGAAIVLSVAPAGLGGNLSAYTGTTDASGLLTVTFSADPATDVNFRITATATASGYASESGFISVIVTHRGGTPVPPTTPALDTIAMIALVALFAFLYARLQVRRRKP